MELKHKIPVPRVPVVSSPADPCGWFEPIPGEAMRVRIGSEDTGGQLTLLENIVSPGAAAPYHFHEKASELFIILEGAIRIGTAEAHITAGPGAAVFVPSGAAHDFVNEGSTPARLLSVFLPGGMEALFRAAVTTKPEDIRSMAAKHGTILIGASTFD